MAKVAEFPLSCISSASVMFASFLGNNGPPQYMVVENVSSAYKLFHHWQWRFSKCGGDKGYKLQHTGVQICVLPYEIWGHGPSVRVSIMGLGKSLPVGSKDCGTAPVGGLPMISAEAEGKC